jgi:RimJ/RimL family protein N-acetyltransferase
MRHLTGRARSREEVLAEWVPVLSRDVGPSSRLGHWAGLLLTDWSTTVSQEADPSGTWTKPRDPFVGWWALNPDPDDPAAAELGYRLRHDAWGRGLATEGARALLAHGFETVGLERIWAQTMAVNERSIAVMTRIGLRFERTWVGEWNQPLPGWEKGEVAYALARDEWLSGQAGDAGDPMD